jgi:hypothetical protein
MGRKGGMGGALSVALFAAVFALVTAGPALAHPLVAAEFDANAPVVSGNNHEDGMDQPHSWIPST